MYTDTNAVYALNSYVRKLLDVNLGMDKTDYGGKDFIIPTAQQPDLMQYAKPFIVYGSAIHPASHNYAMRREAVTYTIYSPSSTEINKIVNLLNDTFERQDEAAADVNDWLDTEAAGRGVSRSVSFGSIRVTFAEKAEPAEEEAGFVAGMVMMECRYTANNNSIVTSGFTYTP